MIFNPFAANDDGRGVAWARRTIKAAAIAALIVAALLAWSLADASLVKRSTAARNQFQKANPCPANGNTRGSCPGYVIDHVVPLCAGGPDTPANMQWQTVAEAREKNRADLARCRPKGPSYHRKQ